MRAVVLTADEATRDLLLAGFEPLHPARLPPYGATRVARVGIGTLVVIPAGPSLAEAAVAAGIAANRMQPDVLLAVGTVAGTAEVVLADRICSPQQDYHVAEQLTTAAATALGAHGYPVSIRPVEAELPAAWGVAVAAQRHGVPAGAILLPPTDAALWRQGPGDGPAGALFGSEWWPTARSPVGP